MGLPPGCAEGYDPVPYQIAWPRGVLLLQHLDLHQKRCSPQSSLVVILLEEQLPLEIAVGWVSPVPSKVGLPNTLFGSCLPFQTPRRQGIDWLIGGNLNLWHRYGG